MAGINLTTFRKISEFEWEIPSSFRREMRGSVRFFATRRQLEAAVDDLSVEQAINASTLPGLVGQVLVMPDVHQGYGFPIGGVAAIRVSDGVISPGAIGYDINCGVRLLASNILFHEVEGWIERLSFALDEACPSGVGVKGAFPLKGNELDDVCRYGARWALKKGLALEEDITRTEEMGCLEGADSDQVSQRAKERGRTQLGTLGSGNHFIEVDIVEQIFDPGAAQAMGLQLGCITVQIHCGSSGF